MTSKLLCWIGLTFLLLQGCVGLEKEPAPDDLIEDRVYTELLLEMQLIQTYRNAQPDKVNVDSLKALIYTKYNVNDEQFLRSHKYYQRQVTNQIERVNYVIEQLEFEQSKIQAYIDSLKEIKQAEQADTTAS